MPDPTPRAFPRVGMRVRLSDYAVRELHHEHNQRAHTGTITRVKSEDGALIRVRRDGLKTPRAYHARCWETTDGLPIGPPMVGND